MPARIETMDASGMPERRGVYLLTHPRSASNLFQTMMAKQPGYQYASYKLFDAGFGALGQLQKGPLSGWPEGDRKALHDAFRAGFESLQDEVADAGKNGQQAFIKEHAIFLFSPEKPFAQLYKDDPMEPLLLKQRNEPESVHTNPSSVPDRFLLSMQPIFQIRHPALMFPSMVRAQGRMDPTSHAQRPMVYCTQTLRPLRQLYDWYLENAANDRKPRVIDADDIMNDPAAVRQLCIETGFDPDAVQYEWEERHEENQVKAAFLTTIYGSKGIVKGLDAKNLDIEVEKAKWKAEFGGDNGEHIAKYVYDAMPDYEYMMTQRTRSK